MLNSNKVSEIKIIVSDLLQDLDSMCDLEYISPLKWEELNMSADNIKRKINTLMIENERQNIIKLKQIIEELRQSISEPVQVVSEPVHVIEETEEEMELFSDINSVFHEVPKRTNIAWKGNILGPRVDDLNDAITLNDKLFFIKNLFNNDNEQYRLSIQRINDMDSMDEALDYTRAAFPDWDEESDIIYRFYMILRRRFDA
jgi:hypothetical protein